MVSIRRLPRRVSIAPQAALLALLVAALALRLFGLDWDQGAGLHPDERYIVQYVLVGRIHLDWPPDWDSLLNPATSGLNPRSVDPATINPETGDPASGTYREFPYGALPLLVTEAVAEIVSRLTGDPWHDGDRVYLLGRSLSALLDTLTILVVYAIGARVFSRRVGLLAAAIAALVPMSIQLAHFFTTDSWLTFFVALCLLCCVRAAEGGSVRWFAAAGACFGLAMATKGSVFTLAGLIGAAVAYDGWRRWRGGTVDVGVLRAGSLRLLVAAVAAIAAFALFEPFALANPGIYLQSLRTQADIVRGIFDVPFTRQYVGTTPVVYQIEQFARWGFGPVAAALALAGAGVLAWRFWRQRSGGQWLLLAWLVGYGAVIALPETKFLRYLAPLVPILAIMAGLALDAVWQGVRRRAGSRVALAVALLLLAGSAAWTAAFVSIYRHEHPRLAASRWIYANLPAGSGLSAEYWDDALPMALGPGLTMEDRQFRSVTMDLYADRPTREDLRVLGDALAASGHFEHVARAFWTGDFAGGAAGLRDAAADAASVPFDVRRRLAEDLAAAVPRLSPPASDLARAMSEAAAQFLDAEQSAALPLLRLADATLATRRQEAATAIYDALDAVDYVVLSSNRVSSAIPRSPWRYPVQGRYYQLLADGRLGFELAAEFARYPALGPLTIPDRDADESFINYDHPRVLVYRKTDFVSRPAYEALMAPALAQPVSPTRHAPRPTLLLDQPVGDLPVVADARWSEAVTGNSPGALAAWLVLLAALPVAGWPLTSLVLGRFADAGWGLSRLAAVLVAGYLVWIGASLQLFAFRAVWCALAVLAVGAIGWAARRRWRRRRGLWTFRSEQQRTAVGGEVVFWAVFGLFLLYRYLNPDGWHPIWGGEKPMEFAHLNATLRSAHFPPYDPWYAGGYLNYYYYGLYLVAFCLKLTGIPSEIGFNLAQPTVIALLASGGYSIAATLGRDLARRRSVAIPAGAIGALLLIGIGNLATLTQVLDPERGPVDPFLYRTWGPSRAIAGAITEFPYFTALYADLHAHVVALPITVLAIALGYAVARDRGRLAISLRAGGDGASRALTFCRLALLALVLGTLAPTNAWDVPVYAALAGAALVTATGAIRGWGRRAAAVVGLGLPLAALAYALFLPFHERYVVLFGSLAAVRTPTPFGEVARHLGGLLAIVVVGLVVVLVPRRSTALPLRQPFVALLAILALLFGRTLVAGIDERVPVVLDAAVVVVVGLVLASASWEGVRRAAWHNLSRLGLALGFGVVLLALFADRVVLAAFIAVATAGGTLWLVSDRSVARFVGLMVGAAAAVGAGTELVVLADDLIGTDWYRMNTIFKFYNQIWVLLALTAAAFVAQMTVFARFVPALRAVFSPRSGSPVGIVHGGRLGPIERSGVAGTVDDAPSLSTRERWAWCGLVVTAVVVAASLLYPLLATLPRLEQRFASDLGSGTLNALDWMEYGTLPAAGTGAAGRISYAGDRAAIDWLNRNVDGSPVIAEASIGPYRCNGSRVSIGTGLPTIIGWERHQQQQRYAETLPERVDDVRRLYTSTDPAEKEAILRRYDVRYVVVGDLERLYPMINDQCTPTGSAEGIAALEAMVGPTLAVAFAADGTTIYRLLPPDAA